MILSLLNFFIIFSHAQGSDIVKGDLQMNLKCSDKPNCVSSFETRSKFSIDSLKNIDGSWSDVETKVIAIMNKNFKAKLIEKKEGYLHFVVTTSLMGYLDDVYFWYDLKNKELNFKSESRVGYWDLGANKKRLNKFIKSWKTE